MLAPALLFAAPYALLLAWFHGVDVYHAHFSSSGPIVFVYNGFRVLFIFYLFWMVEVVGALLLRAVAGVEFEQLGVIARLALAFFAGAGVWHVVMLALGYLDLYTVPLAMVLTLPLVALSYGDARAAAAELRPGGGGTGRLAGEFAPGLLGRLLAGVAAIVFAALLLIKGLYPGGGHDYFTHYFYYLQAVIDRGGVWPNDVWYHYYYDKGAGLYFLAILITDFLAPQLVTFCFMAVAAVALLLTLQRIAPRTLWPLVGVVLFLACYVYTPGAAVLYGNNGGWGEFEKLHEINAAMVMAVLWMTIEALSVAGRARLAWAVGAGAAIVGAIIVNITISIFLGGFFAVLALGQALRRRFGAALLCCGLATVAGCSLIAILVINQLTTGLANDQGILWFWRFADLAKLARWGALLNLIVFLNDYQRLVATTAPLSIHTVVFLVQSLRLELVWPLAAGGLAVALPALLRQRWNRSAATTMAVMAAAGLIFVVLALAFGRDQQVSFYRYASFATAPTIVCAVLCWTLASRDGVLMPLARSGPLALAALLVCLGFNAYPRQTWGALKRGLEFFVGRYSIDVAYQTQYGPAPRLQWSAIYPGSRGAYETVGPRVPIWSFHIHTYCMLPDCLVESYPSFLMTRHWDRVMFGTAEEAKQTLHSGHIDYFLFTRADEIRDPLPLSPLFTPDNISRYLGIRWTDGTSSLLTWLGPGVQPLRGEWVADYARAVAQSGTVQSFPYQAVQQDLAQLHPDPLR